MPKPIPIPVLLKPMIETLGTCAPEVCARVIDRLDADTIVNLAKWLPPSFPIERAEMLLESATRRLKPRETAEIINNLGESLMSKMRDDVLFPALAKEAETLIRHGDVLEVVDFFRDAPREVVEILPTEVLNQGLIKAKRSPTWFVDVVVGLPEAAMIRVDSAHVDAAAVQMMKQRSLNPVLDYLDANSSELCLATMVNAVVRVVGKPSEIFATFSEEVLTRTEANQSGRFSKESHELAQAVLQERRDLVRQVLHGYILGGSQVAGLVLEGVGASRKR